MISSDMLDQRVGELKQIIAGNDGRNAADHRFARAVDELISAVYDDIGDVAPISPRSLFDLFVIKVLYVGRRSGDAAVIDYLGKLLVRYVSARELFPEDADAKPRRMYFSDMLDEETVARFPSRFEAYRWYGDSALFISGVYPHSVGRQRSGRDGPLAGGEAGVDAAYYVTTGKAMYRLASLQQVAESTRQSPVLAKLAEYFEVYVDALNEMSERYITGPDERVIADKMLDSVNRYRASRDERSLADARRYASLLRIDGGAIAG